MLAKVYDQEYKDQGSFNPELVAEAPLLDLELHCMGEDVYIPGH